ncbi:alpha/beta hydrolase [Deinococcus irradiatisoli]|uniref:Alpha/beta hydrolase n=2 Tax=Deinococcus irradiatisoli TaxID=2202254 RepID=A0A2Z3JM05_9DEIO|nr:alpha/beta hydrolase [Deinococcus irradiatisoli]AWN24551.1 alpha/beta hydrolase [Deinococcus irradiatisoli]
MRPTRAGKAHFSMIRGLRTHARVYGDVQAQPIVIVPGLGCASWMYRRLARVLSRWRRVWAYDPPGHGFSQGRLDYPCRIEQLTDHLALWLSANGLQRAPLLGHSLGGEVIIDLAARYPQLGGPLIACAPTGIPENPSVLAQLARLTLDIPRERPSLWPLSAAAYTRAGPLRFYQLASDQSRHDTGPLLPQVRRPVLVLDGTADPVIRSWTVETLTRAIPGARAVQVAGGTHALTDSYPIEVAMHTLDFLEDLAGR